MPADDAAPAGPTPAVGGVEKNPGPGVVGFTLEKDMNKFKKKKK